jgi:RimJ/RimL family protein N-acetyltransferase
MLTLTTRRLVLRPFVPDDFPAFVTALNDLSISRHLARVRYPYHLSDADAFHAFIQSSDARSLFSAVALREEPQRLCGFVSYEWKEESTDAELGYWYERSKWSMGFATEAGAALVTHAFAVNRHPLLVSGYHLDNPASGRVLRKLGFVETGPTSEFSLAQGRYVPSMRMHLSRERWLQNTSRT